MVGSSQEARRDARAGSGQAARRGGAARAAPTVAVVANQEVAPIDELLWALALTHRAMRATVQRSLEDLGIHAGQHFVLESLWNEDDVTCSTLASRLSVSLPTITKAVARMEAEGVVERRQSEADARVVHVRLTSFGRELESTVEQRLAAVVAEATAGIDAPLKAQLVQALWQIRENLGKDVEGVEPHRGANDVVASD